MECPYCHNSTKVINTRHRANDATIWRRRQCISCQAIFTTDESLDWSKSIILKTTSGDVKPFSRDELFISIYSSLKHRSDALDAATQLTTTVLGKLYAQLKGALIERKTLVITTQEVLKHFDKSAANSYQAYHPLSVTGTIS